MTNSSNKRTVQLDCGHKLYFKNPFPDIGDILFCPQCQKYQDVGPREARFTETFYPDYNYTSKPYGKRNMFLGTCTYGIEDDNKCGYQERGTFYNLRETMHSHYMRTHTKWSNDILFQDVPSSKTEAPF